MKSIKLLAALFPLIFLACTSAPESDKAKTTEAKELTRSGADETWEVETTNSKIEWVGTKVTGYHTGEIPIKEGDINLKNDKVVGGRFVMDVNNLTVSGPKGNSAAMNQKLQNHLKSADFFEVSKYPEAVLEITSITDFKGEIRDTTDPRQSDIEKYKVTNPTHKISGNLTMKGITKNIEFPARITVSENSAEAVAKFNINRKDWGVIYEGQRDDLIRDEIHLGILIRAKK
jgi:polyisoprenoid-binding protein YceI